MNEVEGEVRAWLYIISFFFCGCDKIPGRNDSVKKIYFDSWYSGMVVEVE